ncbi:efflux transporter outer membrane subunit [Gluconobacter morbifer]|uniref:Outer membrane channel lipoprotein n=1 Tax=Gluconobacter morbifer G707 TaxID=1088869 RepID=G6XJH8_9PROT|nr:efflux transporter outer membrane subunit [Gluconobacter morbifer]EHH68083.1 outer membrane channel lipoprotein [Gluconobacter morbifer G707]
MSPVTHFPTRSRCRKGFLLLALSALAGCAVGPDFHRPPAPAGASYQATPLTPTSGHGVVGARISQSFQMGVDIPGRWWEIFHNPTLNALVEQALAHNQSLKAMQQGLKSAWEQRRIEGAGLYPTLSAEFNPTRNKTARSLSNVPMADEWLYNLHTAQLNVSYVPDLWGGRRRAIEAAGAQAEIQKFQLEATALTLITNLVEATIQEAEIRGQIDAIRTSVMSERGVLLTLQGQHKLGDASMQDVAGQQSALAQLEASLPSLESQLAQTRDQIATFMGVPPSTPLPEFRLEQFMLPATLPVSFPSDLLNQRPDVRAAQEQIHSAAAQIGVAIANRLPNLQLSATPGQIVNDMQEFFKPGFGNWTIGATIMQPIFQGGSLLHAQRQARDNLLQANEMYEATVLSAIQDVADSIHAVTFDADALEADSTNLEAAENNLRIAQGRLRLGDVSELTLLQAQQTTAQARLAYVQAEGARFSDSVGLFQSLGGGWWHRNDLGMTPAQQKNLGTSLLPW